MHRVSPYSLWLGHVGDSRDVQRVLAAGIVAVIDLAMNEPPMTATRELVYCRFPLIDGSGNPPWLLRLAIETTAGLMRSRTPTLVFCGVGMSRSPAVAAAALALVSGKPPEECLIDVARIGPSDVSPELWRELMAVMT